MAEPVADPVAASRPRRLKWTCRFCNHPFDTFTRKGLKVTCPSCKRVQEGPAGIDRIIRESEELRARLSKRRQRPELKSVEHTKVTVRAEQEEPHLAVVAEPEPPAEETLASQPAAPARRSGLDRFLFGAD